MLHAWKLAFIHPCPGLAERGVFFGPGARRKSGGATPPLTEFFSGAGVRTGAASEEDALFFCCPPPADFAAAARFLSRETLRVAVTGSPGCGKSSLLKTWQDRGIPVFSADAEVQRLYGRGGDGQRLLRTRFGDRFVPDPDGPVDKLALGAALRDNDSLRRELESLIHPLVRHALRSFWEEQEERGATLAAAEVPLYLETDFAGKRRFGPTDGRTGAADEYPVAPEAAHVLVGVHCPFPLRRDRLMGKRGWTEDTIARMESWQWPEEKKMAACGLILDNTGTERDLEERAGELAGVLFALRQQRADSVLARLEALWTDDMDN
jgi:23S rRNA pseudouridine1911/1915/1917 synthase